MKKLIAPDYPRKDWSNLFALLMVGALLMLIGGMLFSPGERVTGAKVFEVDYKVTATTNISLLFSNYSYFEEEDGSKAGEAIVSVDLNGDGNNDILIGAPLFNNGDGKVYGIYKPFVNGSHNLSTANISLVSGSGNESLGYALDTGDVDSDGSLDILVGARWKDDGGFTDTGGAYLIYNIANLGGNVTNITAAANTTFYGETTNDLAGSALAIGDVNNDTYDDVIIGAPLYDESPSADTGKVYVFYGPVNNSANFNLGLANKTLTNTVNNANFGSEILIADINNDLIDDMVIGSPGEALVYLIFGPFSPSGAAVNISNAANVTFNGTAGSLTGDYHTLSIGDVNNDNYDDLLIGAPWDTTYGGSWTGRAFLIYGNNSLNGIIDLNTSYPQFIPEVVGDTVGYSTELSDYNGDGLDDIFIGAPGNDEGGNLAGKIYMFEAPVDNVAYNLSLANESWIGSALGQALGLISKGSVVFGFIIEGVGSSILGLFGLTIVDADFTASTTTVTEGSSITFTDTSSGSPTSWSWNFAGGTPGTSTTQNPVIVFNTDGTYTVTLTSNNGEIIDTETKVGYITVNDPVVPPPSGGGGGSRPDCRDGRDNDNDGLIDEEDPACNRINSRTGLREYDSSHDSEVDRVCNEDYLCTDWSKCELGAQTRICEDFYQCQEKFDVGEVDLIIEKGKPIETRECEIKPVIEEPKQIVNYGPCVEGKLIPGGDIGACSIRCLNEDEVASVDLTSVGDLSAGFGFKQIVDDKYWAVYSFDGQGVIEFYLNKEFEKESIFDFFKLKRERSLWAHAVEFNVPYSIIAGVEIACDGSFDPDWIGVTRTDYETSLIDTIKEKIPKKMIKLIIDNEFNILYSFVEWLTEYENIEGPYPIVGYDSVGKVIYNDMVGMEDAVYHYGGGVIERRPMDGIVTEVYVPWTEDIVITFPTKYQHYDE